MPLETAKTANLGEARIVIHAHFEIRIPHPSGCRLEFVGQAKHARIARQLQRSEMKITVRSDGRYAVAVDRAQIADQPAKAHEIALVERHQADEAAGSGSPRCRTPLIRNHDPTIPCRHSRPDSSRSHASLDAGAVEYSGR